MAGVDIVKVIHVIGEESIKEAISVAPLVDAILLDSGNKYLPIKQLRGTGDFSYQLSVISYQFFLLNYGD